MAGGARADRQRKKGNVKASTKEVVTNEPPPAPEPPPVKDPRVRARIVFMAPAVLPGRMDPVVTIDGLYDVAARVVTVPAPVGSDFVDYDISVHALKAVARYR